MIKICHTPDADDAFMFYALETGKISHDLNIEFCVDDIQTLNKKLFENNIDVSAASVYASFLLKNYSIMRVGGSFGKGYGPVIVTKNMEKYDENKIIAIPGRLTTSYIIYKLFYRFKREIEIRFDKIIDEILAGHADYGLLIHEGQDVYKKYNLKLFSSLYDEWEKATGFKILPLGINVIRNDLNYEIKNKIYNLIKKSVEYSLNNVEEALNFAMKYSRDNSREIIKKFALKYVNDLTVDMGDEGINSIKKVYEMAKEKNLISGGRISFFP
ncbi:MAG: menaquinone biosynthesis family protein [Thermoplasmata archaeon]